MGIPPVDGDQRDLLEFDLAGLGRVAVDLRRRLPPLDVAHRHHMPYVILYTGAFQQCSSRARGAVGERDDVYAGINGAAHRWFDIGMWVKLGEARHDLE